MREPIKQAIGETVQDLVNSGIETSFSERELKNLGVIMPEVKLTSKNIKELRKKLKLSQVVFAKLLNVSPSAIRQWEQGRRKPSGSTQVLLDLLYKSPNVLSYRLNLIYSNKELG